MRSLLKPLTLVIVMTSGLIGCASSAPKRLTDGADRLTPCPSSPRCVSSQAPADSDRYVEPLRYQGDPAMARDDLVQAIEDRELTIRRVDNRMVHAIGRTTLGFVDDLTLLIATKPGRIDVKSAARIGYYDFGVNRRRVEGLREAFDARRAQREGRR